MKWSKAKHELQQKSKGELVGYLKRLFDLSAENKSFFEANLAGNDGVSPKYYKQEISESVNPGIESPIDLRRGRKAISSYRKAAPNDLWGRVDLMIHFVEQGADFTLEYGDINGPFYDSLCRMINSIVDLSPQLSSVEHAYLAKRFEDLDSITKDQIGWGFSDHISDATTTVRVSPVTSGAIRRITGR